MYRNSLESNVRRRNVSRRCWRQSGKAESCLEQHGFRFALQPSYGAILVVLMLQSVIREWTSKEKVEWAEFILCVAIKAAANPRHRCERLFWRLTAFQLKNTFIIITGI